MRAFLQRQLEPARLVAAILTGLAIFFIVASVRVGLWESGMPGSGLTAFLGGVVLAPIAMSLYLSQEAEGRTERFRAVPLVGGALIVLYALLLPVTGFALGTAALLATLMTGLLRRSLIEGLVAAAILSTALAALFSRILMVPLPVWPMLP